MKKFAIAAALASVIAVPVFADTKIAVVDMQQVLATSKSGQAIGKQLREKFTPRQKALVALQSKVKGEASDLKKMSSTASAKDLAAKKNQLNTDTLQLQQMQAKFFQDVGVERQKSMQDLYKKLQATVAGIAKKNDYTMVMAKRLALYSEPSIDITDQVKKELD